MSGLLALEDFGGSPSATDLSQPSNEGANSQFEEGYRAGWDDAVAAAQKQQSSVTDDLAKTLADISFGFNEARNHVLNSLAPVLTTMAEKLLPEAARAHFAETVLAAARDIAESASDQPVELAVAAESREAIERVFPDDLPFAIEIIEDPMLGPGQAQLRAADMEKVLDIAAAENAIRNAVSDFLTIQSEERLNG